MSEEIRLTKAPPWHRIVVVRTQNVYYTTDVKGDLLTPEGMQTHFNASTRVLVYEKADEETIAKLLTLRHPWKPDASPRVLKPNERGPYNKPLQAEIERLKKENQELMIKWYKLKVQMDTVADVVQLYKESMNEKDN